MIPQTLVDSDLIDRLRKAGPEGVGQLIIELDESLPRPLHIVPDSYEIAKVFNTPTHQVVMLKSFEEEAERKQIGYDEDDEEVFEVEYNTSYQIQQIMFHKGVRISRAFGYQEEADRDKYWVELGQQQAQKFVDVTVKFIEENSDSDESAS